MWTKNSVFEENRSTENTTLPNRESEKFLFLYKLVCECVYIYILTQKREKITDSPNVIIKKNNNNQKKLFT